MREDMMDIKVTPELIERSLRQQEKYKDIIEEWSDTNEGKKKPRYYTELRQVCKINNVDDQYLERITEEWAARFFYYDVLLKYDEDKEGAAGFRTYFHHVVGKKRILDLLNNKEADKKGIKRKGYYFSCGRNETEINKDSLDSPINDEEDTRTLGDVYFADKSESFEDEVCNEMSDKYSPELITFMNQLSDIAKDVLFCKMDGYEEKKDIEEKLGITEKECTNALKEIARKASSPEMLNIKQKRLGTKTDTRTKENNNETEEVKEESKMTTKEKNKIIATNVKDYLEDVGRKEIRPDLALQRAQGIWTPEMVGNLITTVLSGYPFPNIICAEDGRSGDVYIIDGGQRTDALNRFMNNLIPINKKSEHLEVTYDEPEYDENGDIKENEKGFGIFHPVTVNVGGKYFKDLPAELQRKFCKGPVMLEKYLACTTEEMAWHMRRYNNMKPMTASQKGLTYLGMDMGKNVINITKNHNFFRNFNKYTKLSPKSYLNGDFNRIINESLMAIYFLNDWKKKQTDLNTYLRLNASKEMVSSIDELLTRLIEAGVEDVKEMFTSKNSFIWITLFQKFTELDIEDCRFIEFMKEFRDSLHEKELNGITYDILDTKASKDKTTVIAKINHLEGLMREYFSIDDNTPDDDDDSDKEEIDVIDNGANEIDEISTEVNTDEVDRSDIEVVNEVIEVVDESDNSVEVEEVPFEVDEVKLEKEIVEAATGEEYPLPNIADDTIINQPVKEAEWIQKEEDAKNGISPNAEVLRDYVEEFYDNEYGINAKDMVSEADAKRMAIETMLIYSGDSDLSMEHMAEYCQKEFTHAQYENMKDIVRASKEVNYFAENVEDTSIFEDYENYPMLTLLMIYMGTNRQGVVYSDEEIVEWLNDLTPRYEDMCVKAKSKTDIFRAMITDLKDYKAKKNTTMVEKKRVNLDF